VIKALFVSDAMAWKVVGGYTYTLTYILYVIHIIQVFG